MSRAMGILVATLLGGCASIPLESPGATSPGSTSRVTLPPVATLAPRPSAVPPTATASVVATVRPSKPPTQPPSLTPTQVATNPPPTSAQPSNGNSADIDALLARVPDHLGGDCHEVTSFDGGFLFGVQCINLPDIDGYVTYYQFDTTENLNASYEGNRSFFAPDAAGTDCSLGPSESSYTVAGNEAGRVFCADYDDGQILTWTSEPLNVEATIVLYGGTYSDLNGIWQDAGPLLGLVSPTTGPSSPGTGANSWADTAGEYRDQAGATFTYNCPPGGDAYTVYGTDTYTDDSSVCTAAVHAGLITFALGGSVVIQIVDGLDSYEGTERNGVSTNNWRTWDVSFIFVTT